MLFDALGAWPRHDYKAAPNWTNTRPELSDQTNMAAHWDFLTTRMHRKRRNERSRAINTLNTVWSTNWKHIWLYLKLPDNDKEATNDFYWLSGRSARNKYEEPLKENAAVVKECKRLPHMHKAEEHFYFWNTRTTPKRDLKCGISQDLSHHRSSFAIKGDFFVVPAAGVLLFKICSDRRESK